MPLSPLSTGLLGRVCEGISGGGTGRCGDCNHIAMRVSWRESVGVHMVGGFLCRLGGLQPRCPPGHLLLGQNTDIRVLSARLSQDFMLHSSPRDPMFLVFFIGRLVASCVFIGELSVLAGRQRT